MNVLVTGGAGFIGSHIVDQLVADGHDVVVVDDLDPNAHDGLPEGLSPDARYLWKDVRDASTWRDVLAGVEAVCHQAAMVGLGVDFGDAQEYASRNVTGTACLLKALHEASFSGRVVLASSMVVYGEGRYRCAVHGTVRPGPRMVSELSTGRFDPVCPTCGRSLSPEAVPEDQAVDPRNVYAVTKYAQEGLCGAYAREHPGCTATLLRYHNVYGPRMPRGTPYAGVASIFRSAYANGEAPLLFEDGGQIRDFVHVGDVARANLIALTTDQPVGGAFNICSGEPRTIAELAEVSRPDGAPPPRVVGSFRLGDVRHVFADPSRAAATLGFRAEIDFATGVRSFATAPLRSASGRRDGPASHA